MHSLHNNRAQLIFTTTLFNAAMQGVEVEQSVITALERIFEQEQNFDVVVIIRGGGAKTDLRWFDNYSIAAHIAQFPLPVITGIGHDKDLSIADIVAHTALKTPTAVAEFLIDRMSEVLQQWQDLHQRLTTVCATIVEQQRSQLADYKHRLEIHGKHRIENELLRLQFAGNQLEKSVKTAINQKLQQIENYKKHLKTVAQQSLNTYKQRLQLYETKIAANNIETILAKGFTLTTNADGKRIHSVNDVHANETLRTYFADGVVESVVN